MSSRGAASGGSPGEGERWKVLLLAVVAILVAAVVVLALLLLLDDDSSRDPSLLHVQQARSGSLEPRGGSDYELTLNGASPETVFFSDRPDRFSGLTATKAFVHLKSLFSRDDPPNAAVVLGDGSREQADVVIVELKDPRYSQSRQAVTYTVTLIDDASRNLEAWEGLADSGLPRHFGRVTVFIDDDVPDPTNCYSLDDSNVDVTVKDGSGDPLEGAKVQLFETSGTTPTAAKTTDSSGEADFPNVNPTIILTQAFDRIVATHSGYRQGLAKTLACGDQTATVEITLQPE